MFCQGKLRHIKLTMIISATQQLRQVADQQLGAYLRNAQPTLQLGTELLRTGDGKVMLVERFS